MKKLLIFIDWFVPAYKAGGPISSIRNQCLALQNEYEIFVIAGDTDLGDIQPLTNVPTNTWTTVLGVQVQYLNIKDQTQEKYQAVYREIQPDVVHLNSLFSKKFTLLPLKAFQKHDAKIVVSPRGMFGPASLKIKPFKKKLFFIYAKANGLFKNVHWHATSSIEEKEIQQKFSNAKITIASNFPYLPTHKEGHLEKKSGVLKMICVGRIAPIKNVDFLLRSLKSVQGKVTLKLVGPAEDEVYFQQCLSIVKQLPENVNVSFIKGVSFQEVDKLYQECHIFITATKNENFGHSIVESFGHSCPVIISDATPWKSLATKGTSGVGVDLKLEEKEFENAVNRFIMMDETEFDKMRVDARTFAEEIFNDSKRIEAYKRLF